MTTDQGQTSPRTSRFHIGTAGWSYDDWQGAFYPSPPPPRFQPLTWYARFFNLVEVNATFYRVLPPHYAEKWCRDVAARDDFVFTLKLWQALTHERPAKPPRREVDAIRAMCGIFRANRRLGALLMQFPWSFRFSEENLEYLTRLLDLFPETPVAVEVRHAGWNNDRYLGFLRERSAAFCNIDQPVLHDCLSPTAHATADFSYLRVHGRNAANWFAETEKPSDRYDYYYDPRELADLSDLARALADQTSRVMVTTNNHFRGQAAANALQFREALEGCVDEVPAPLLKAFPDIRRLKARRPPEPEPGEQQELF